MAAARCSISFSLLCVWAIVFVIWSVSAESWAGSGPHVTGRGSSGPSGPISSSDGASGPVVGSLKRPRSGLTLLQASLQPHLRATDGSKGLRSGPPKLIIAGAPAAGKGTQCEVIKSKFGVVHLSTGDLLRRAVADLTPLGIKVKDFMDNGRLVPDELITDLVCDRLREGDCTQNGWLLDGFPRTAFQADALVSRKIHPDCFILLDVPEGVLVERVIGRRTDPLTGVGYHLTFKPPPNDETILRRLVQRSDDTEEKIVVRYQDFKKNIDAVKSRYLDKIRVFDGTLAPSQLSEEICATVRDMCKAP
jgi:adenylate kinase